MSIQKGSYHSKDLLTTIIKSALGQQKAELVIKNGHFLDVFNGRFIQGDVAISHGIIVGINESYEGETEIDAQNAYIVPGFIDAHVHIESSLMTPTNFQNIILPCGTTTTIWDPHEITNVKGTEAIQWALDSTENLLLDVFVMLPSCVPAVNPNLDLDTSGAILTAQDLVKFKTHPRVLGLGELMNFPGILNCDDDILNKLIEFEDFKLDGHCPTLSGKILNAYAAAGIHNDHESTTFEEGLEKLTKGIHVLIREGSCAKDADTLLNLLNAYTSKMIGLCSDDRNPADIDAEGHIDCIINKALKRNLNPVDIFTSASFAAAIMYDLKDRGAIAPGYIADLCLITTNDGDWKNGITIQKVYKKGTLIEKEKLVTIRHEAQPFTGKNLHFNPCQVSAFEIPSQQDSQQNVHVIGIRPFELLTDDLQLTLPVIDNKVQLNINEDILKIAVFERHKSTGNHCVGFVKGFGLRQGAIATSINHDSHNVIVVGADENMMAEAVNRLLEIDGGIVVISSNNEYETLPLPIGGLMTDSKPEEISEKLHALKNMASNIGCVLDEPFLQLAFLALPVIPYLKITDRGLVDVENLKVINVCIK